MNDRSFLPQVQTHTPDSGLDGASCLELRLRMYEGSNVYRTPPTKYKPKKRRPASKLQVAKAIVSYTILKYTILDYNYSILYYNIIHQN